MTRHEATATRHQAKRDELAASVLLVLADAAGPLTVSEIHEALGPRRPTRPTVDSALRALAAQGKAAKGAKLAPRAFTRSPVRVVTFAVAGA